ncbi:hypothetical protein EW145_g2724 [Phellinidium pouzarii]|uniref:Histone deacetylase interacting domain-containing protein n=1 Tax=Phellinidium pouzarii TaxID=167371 RepID=A0A4S4LBB5_9AGAM|nr:hypothetical protein EW145_g2724 [Phellinidium pouzarii]
MEISAPVLQPEADFSSAKKPAEFLAQSNEELISSSASDTGRNGSSAADARPGIQEEDTIPEEAKKESLEGSLSIEEDDTNTPMDFDSAVAEPADDSVWPEDTFSAGERPLNVNDALFYLDAVKKQFSKTPVVYNKFLDIMKDFKNQTIDTPGVIQRVSSLFSGYPSLIEGFNTFLPAGYRIECTVDAHDINIITVTTPDGTTVQSQSADPSEHTIEPNSVSSLLAESLPYTHEQISPAMEYVTKIKQRFAGHADLYQEFLEILNLYKNAPVDEARLAARIAKLFQNSPDLLSGLQHFVPWEMFSALDSSALAEKEGLGAKQGKKKVTDTASVPGAVSGPQKRKRKALDREKEKERERDREYEAPPRASQNKTKRLKHQRSGGYDSLHVEDMSRSPGHSYNHLALPLSSRPGPSAYDVPPPSASHIPTQDDMFFFERVRLAIGSREVYNEFLKLINLFTQEIIDMRRLVEQSQTFLGDELLGQFKEILGWDASWDSNNGGIGSANGPNGLNGHSGSSEGMERLTKDNLSIRYGPSYRRLPASEANVPCSGRDDMCKSVLNDEWVSHPTWASEDSGFVAHRKNAYEEALHRSEEERHEYDFHIEAISSTIVSLEPFHMKIMQLSPEERAASKQKMPLSGVNKAIHQRIIKKVYGREAGLEVIQAIHDSPAIAIPIVFQRLKQKEEEWKKAQREWNKVWREIDARNYQKSLDHQGINFKANDKKAITMKTFMNQIESVREEQMAKRASLIDPLFARTRPRYQMAFVIDDVSVLQDVFKLTFSLLDRMHHHISVADRRRIEGFLRSFVPLFFMVDPVTFNGAFQARSAVYDADYFLSDDFSMFIDEIDETSSIGSTSRSGRNGRRGAGNDLRKKILKNNVQEKSGGRKGRVSIQSNLISRFASPAPIAGTSLVDTSASSDIRGNGRNTQQSIEESASADIREKPIRRGSFFTNSYFYSFLRLVELLYSRLSTCKGLAMKLASDPASPYLANPVASDLALLDTGAPSHRLAELQKGPSPAAHFYGYLLEACEKLFDNEIDQQAFEDITRYMFGTRAYIMFTVDKVIGAIIKQVQNILSENKSLVILEGLKRERDLPTTSSLDLDEIRSNAEKAIGPDENLFRIDWAPNSHTTTIQLLGKDDASFDDYDVYTGRWQAYIDSFVSDETTRGLADSNVKPPFLTRNLRLIKKIPLSDDFVSQSGLEIKVCVRTYRMFFVSQTEDFLFREWSSRDLKEVIDRSKSRVIKTLLPTTQSSLMAMTEVPLWINGQRRSASDLGTFEVRNPLSGKVVGSSASATSQDCKDAVEAAGKAFETWESTPAPSKRAVFLKAADLIQTEKYKKKITQSLQEETAAVEMWSRINMAGSLAALLEAASMASQVKGEIFPSPSATGGLTLIQRRAHGVILSIAPWNSPVSLSFRGIVIPLICGNTIIMKSSEYSPRTQEIVVELMHEAGLPPGVLNYISVSRENSPNLTAELIGHPLIRHINFTGSDRVGKTIAGEAAKYLKPCVLELGGKAPAVVLDDADIDAAARAIAHGALLHSGQICMSTERVIVQRKASETLVPKLQAHFSSLRAGDPSSDPSAKLSALFSEGAADNIVSMLKEAREAGAEILVGDLNRDGAVVQPHLIRGIRPGMRAWDKESFGPVVGIAIVDTIEEAVKMANATEYSLTASVWSKDVTQALNIAGRIRVGFTSINGATVHSEPGIGHVGLGGATGYGRFDIDHFTIKRMIVVHPSTLKTPPRNQSSCLQAFFPLHPDPPTPKPLKAPPGPALSGVSPIDTVGLGPGPLLKVGLKEDWGNEE